MSWKLARKDMDLLIRNPITYLGIILMIWIVFYTVSPFWNLYGNVRDEKSSVVYDSDGEIEDGYIPTPTEVVYQNVMQELREKKRRIKKLKKYRKTNGVWIRLPSILKTSIH